MTGQQRTGEERLATAFGFPSDFAWPSLALLPVGRGQTRSANYIRYRFGNRSSLGKNLQKVLSSFWSPNVHSAPEADFPHGSVLNLRSLF